jgi:hypothetical protein
MSSHLELTLPNELVAGFQELIRRAVADALADQQPQAPEGFLDVDGAAAFLSSTPSAIRSLVKSDRIPVHRTPVGRLLFDRDELRAWATSERPPS